ncbi:MAG: ABC transporter permease, partial [Acidimicrobiia bacterium]|nr:ABC transporter permease [Acidimicrobiia bacterium]
MLRLTLKNLAGNRVRFALTAFAVVLAVSFVVSSFVLTDGLRQQFDGLSAEIVEGTDLMVRPVEPDFGETPNLSDTIVAQVAATDGVAAAAPVVGAPDNAIRPIPPDGELISTNGPPQIAMNWVDNPALSSFTLVQGRAPRAEGEFAMDVDAAAAHGFTLGGTYDVLTPTGTVSETLTGLTRFGADNATLGATLMQFPTASLQRLTGETGVDSVAVAVAGGADRGEVQAALASLAPGTEVIDNATLLREQQDGFNQGISIMGNVLLGFAAVSLFVSIFIIYNTFAIVLGQRTRELGLLRLVGADPRQIRRSVLGEALVIGIVSSVLGIGAGALVAQGLTALFDALGASLPEVALVISARTVIVALVVGIGATMVSAVGPARKAARVAPIVALRDGAAAGTATGRVRLAVGTLVLAAGLALGGTGLFAASGTATVVSLLGIGAAAVFIGVTLVSPVAAVPVTRALAWPARATAGVAGRLAGQNAGRNPQRTATTAAALMIGLAAVTMALVVGESVKAELRSTVASSVTADYIVTEQSGNFPAGLAATLDASPQVAAVSSFRLEEVRTGAAGETADVTGARLAEVPALFDLDVTEGSLTGWAGTVADPVAVAETEASRLGLAPGDTVGMDFGSGQHRDLTVVAVFADEYVVETPYLLDLSTWDAVGASDSDGFLS